MPIKLTQCCDFLYSFKQITWTRTTVTICMMPFACVMLILVILFLLSAEQPGSVVSNSLVCAAIGKDVLEEGGSAVDAAIATMLCEGIALPNSAGIGGGFTAVMYSNGKFDSIVATPTVPAAFWNKTEADLERAQGAMAVGIPGELRGYWEMHHKYGVMSWKRLIEPSITLCEEGVPITEWLAGIFRYHKERLIKSKTMGYIFNFWDAESFAAEHRIKFPQLAKTLRIIADYGVKPFYEGELGDKFVADIQKDGGVMTKHDLETYHVEWDPMPPMLHWKGRFKIVTTPLPTAGAIVVLALNIVKNLDYNTNPPLFWHTFVEAMKHGFGHSGLLGDSINNPKHSEDILRAYFEMQDSDFARKIRDLIKDDSIVNDTEYYGSKEELKYANGSANICISSPRGDVVAATTSILSEFGAFFASTSTGIIGNNLVRRFMHNKLQQVRVSATNKIMPGKRVFCPYCPTIVLQQTTASPFFIVGASGGPKAITIVTTAIIKYVMMAKSAHESVNNQYLHNQLFPNQVEYEDTFDSDTLNYLNKVGHKVVQQDTTYENFTAVTCIGHRLPKPDAEFDERAGGSKALVHAKSDLNILLVILVGGLATSIVGIVLFEVLNPGRGTLSQIKIPIANEYQQTEA